MSLPQDYDIFDLVFNTSHSTFPALKQNITDSLWPERPNASFLVNSNGTGIALVELLNYQNVSYLAMMLLDSILDEKLAQGWVYCTCMSPRCSIQVTIATGNFTPLL